MSSRLTRDYRMHRLRTTVAIVVSIVAIGMTAGCSAKNESSRATTAESTSTTAAALTSAGAAWSRDALASRVGATIFDDPNLSLDSNQSCADCHGRSVGWTGPDEADNSGGAVYEGSVAGRFGNRKPPSSAYATLAPIMAYDPAGGFTGGAFWDGRATGWKLGSPAADQAQGPFLNPLEQALPDAHALMKRVCGAPYGDLFRAVWGASSCEDVTTGFDDVARSIAAFEGSRSVNAFRSRFDAARAGRGRLSPQQQQGLDLFNGKAHCSRCHTSEGDDTSHPPLFTDFGYDNIGVPRNPKNPFYGEDHVIVGGEPVNPLGGAWVDLGLGGFLRQLAATDDWRELAYVPAGVASLTSEELMDLATQEEGKQRVPTLRNVDKRPSPGFVKAYTHNGYFKTLKALIHFYNTRDVLPRCAADVTEAEALAMGCWPAPEVPATVNTADTGDLGLTAAEEDALEAFLGALTDEDCGDGGEAAQ